MSQCCRLSGQRLLGLLQRATVHLVDDGIATGATMRAAIQALRQQKPAKIIVAVPVAAIDTCKKIAKLTDSLVCPLKLRSFYGVGASYEEFPQNTDAEVRELLKQSQLL